MANDLEERLQNTFNFILEYATENRRTPTFDEIQHHSGASRGTVANDIKRLVEKGLIGKEQNGRLTISNTSIDQRHFAPYITFNRDQSGNIIEEVVRTCELPNSLFGHSEKQYLFRACGDAMVEKRIYDGDILAVNRQKEKDGDIVIAMVGEETVCRILATDEDGNTYLKAANSSKDAFGNRIFDIHPEKDLQILGVVRNVIIMV